MMSVMSENNSETIKNRAEFKDFLLKSAVEAAALV
jgi:hypothetical protein